MKIVASVVKALKENKGKPRIWLQGNIPQRAGFTPGAAYEVERHPERTAIVLRINPEGRYTVSKKDVRGKEQPLIDLNSASTLGDFEGMAAVRIVMGKDQIWILPLAFEVKAKERAERLKRELAEGRITTAEVCHGAGVMANAMHHGLKESGLAPELLWAVELEEDALDLAIENNDAWNESTVPLAMPMQDLAWGDEFVAQRLPRVSLLACGIPCTAASSAGRAKKHLSKPEDDPKAGHLCAPFLSLVAKVNPAVVVIENVSLYWRSAGAAIIRTSLQDMGYVLSEVEINCGEYALEARVRHVLVASTRGVSIEIEKLVAPPRVVQTLGDVLQEVPEDSSLWSAMEYLKVKEKRDVADGKGFRMAIGSLDDTSVGTLGRGYAKCRSTELKIPHPTNPDLLRQLTVKEHAAVKGVPQRLVEGVSITRGHELLGQSVVWPTFKAIGAFIGARLASMNVPNELQYDQAVVA